MKISSEDNYNRLKETSSGPTASATVDTPPVAMNAVGFTTEFPRKDNIYKQKESIPFDESYAAIWLK